MEFLGPPPQEPATVRARSDLDHLVEIEVPHEHRTEGKYQLPVHLLWEATHKLVRRMVLTGPMTSTLLIQPQLGRSGQQC